MFDPSVLVTAFTAVWDADTFLPTYFPGGLRYGRQRGEKVKRPFATIDIQPTAKQLSTFGSGLQESVVTIRATVDDKVGNLTKVADAMHAAFDWCQKKITASLPKGAYCMHVLPMVPETIGQSPDEKGGQNVNQATAAWQVTINST